MQNTGHKKRLSIGQRLNVFKKGVTMAVTGRYEGARNSRHRKTHSTQLNSGDQELDFGVSDNLISRARELEQNVGIVSSIIEKFAKNVVGTCEMQWATGDTEIDSIYEENWRSRMKMLDARGVHHFRRLTMLAVQSMVRDGDLLGQLVNDDNERFVISMIEADRVRTIGGHAFSADEPSVRGGVILDNFGRPLGYRVWERGPYGSTFTTPREIPARDMVHVWEPKRVDSNRGVTQLAPVLNHLQDLKETVESEVSSVKTLSKMSIISKLTSGSHEAPASLGDDTSQEGNDIKVEEIGQNVMSYILPSEDIKAFESDRPSPAWQGLVELVIRHIAAGLSLPYSVVWSFAGLTGPAVRADLAAADRTFADMHDLLMKQWFAPIVGRVMSIDIQNGDIPNHPNWHKFQARRPRKLTIDVGRDTKSDLDAMEAGVADPITYTADNGQDFREVTRRAVRARQIQIEEAAKADLPVGDVFPDRMRGPKKKDDQ